MLYGRTKDIINKFYSPWDGFLINVTYGRLRTELRVNLDWSADYWELDKVGREREWEERGEERGRAGQSPLLHIYMAQFGCIVLYKQRLCSPLRISLSTQS